MKKLLINAAIGAAAMGVTLTAAANDRRTLHPIANAMADNDAQSRLGNTVKFYFGDQPVPKVLARLGTDKTSTRTNAFGKADTVACNWAFLTDMLQLQKRAKALGANAVINIVSNYKNVEFSSSTEFECHVGALMAGAAFKGEFVKIAE
jgi:uncharacterized protein YbjQ (UPF0145 family)